MEKRIAKANQVFIRGAKTKESAENAIEIASNGQATPKWIKVIKRRGSNEHDEALGYVAEMQNRDEITAILKGAKNLKESKDCKDIFIKPNQTKKQRERYQKLRVQLEEVRASLPDSEMKYPAIRNNRIVCLENNAASTTSTNPGTPKQITERLKQRANARTGRKSKNRVNQ